MEEQKNLPEWEVIVSIGRVEDDVTMTRSGQISIEELWNGMMMEERVFFLREMRIIGENDYIENDDDEKDWDKISFELQSKILTSEELDNTVIQYMIQYERVNLKRLKETIK